MRVWRSLILAALVAASADPTQPTESSKAANVARTAANEANEVAIKSVGVTEHAQSALKVARNAMRDARASAGGLSENQKQLLKSAEGELRDATLSAEYGKLQQAKWLKAKGHFVARKETTLKKLEDKVQTVSTEGSEKSELESLRGEVSRLQTDLDTRTAYSGATYSSNGKSDADLRKQLSELQSSIDALESAEGQDGNGASHDELKAEIESLKSAIENLETAEMPEEDNVESMKLRLRELERERELLKQLTEERRKLELAKAHQDAEEQAKLQRELEILEARRHILEQELRQDGPQTEEALLREIHELEQRIDALENTPDTGTLVYEMPPATKVPLGTLASDGDNGVGGSSGAVEESEDSGPEETPVRDSGIDIDTAMPYGELEPFGREDTAQELTESSIQESDEMVDQLERAEVAEEKRAVFRALTRLRGAAITSFDGVARSQTGNIDEYNKLHKWRRTHPLHHLADEESDISKWAFPDNADF